MVTPSSDHRAIINLLDISKAKILLVIERINHCLQDQHFGGKFPIAMKMSARCYLPPIPRRPSAEKIT